MEWTTVSVGSSSRPGSRKNDSSGENAGRVYRSRLIEPLLSKLRECWVSQDSHLSSRSKLSAVTVAPPSRKTSGVPHGVGQLMLDEVEAKAQHFIQNGSRHGPKAMTCHFLFADPPCASEQPESHCCS